MAVVLWVKQKRARRYGSSLSRERTGERVYLVQMGDDSDPDTVMQAPGIPVFGNPFGITDPTLVANDKSAEEVPNAARLWSVTVKYAPLRFEGFDGEDETDPLARSQDVEFAPTEFVEDAWLAFETPVAKDEDGNAVPGFTTVAPEGGLATWTYGKAVCNSAGQSFDPSVPRAHYDQTLVLTRNVETFDWTRAETYQDSVNSDVFRVSYKGQRYTFQKGQARIAFFGASGRFERIPRVDANGVTTWERVDYMQERIEIQLRRDGWIRKVLDQGMFGYLTDDITPSTPKGHFKDGEGKPVSEPVPMNGKGGRLPAGASCVYLHYKLYSNELPFGSLVLDEP